jgi:hypothetical protein
MIFTVWGVYWETFRQDNTSEISDIRLQEFWIKGCTCSCSDLPLGALQSRKWRHLFKKRLVSCGLIKPNVWNECNDAGVDPPSEPPIMHFTNSSVRTPLYDLVVRVSGYRSRRPGFDSRRLQIFWEAVGLERGPLSLVRTTEELLGRNSSGFGQENRDYRPGDPLR